MINFKKFFLWEQAEKHHVLSFGRMNPPTAGHQKLVDKVHQVAKQHDAGHDVVISHSHDNKKNPLSPQQKLQHAKNAFSKTNVVASSKESPTILHHASRLHRSGVRHLHVVAGSDRVDEMHKLLHRYNDGQSYKHGSYKFKSITVHSAGARDPDAEGTTGISASKMRDHAVSGNQKEFHKGAPSSMSDEHKAKMYHDVRSALTSK